MPTEEEWQKAHQHVTVVIGQYKALIGQPGVNVSFGLGMLYSMLAAYNSGQRSDDLYESMVGAE